MNNIKYTYDTRNLLKSGNVGLYEIRNKQQGNIFYEVMHELTKEGIEGFIEFEDAYNFYKSKCKIN